MSNVVTMYDLLKDERIYTTAADKARHLNGVELPHALEGMKPRKPAVTEGLVLMSPEELLTVKIDVVSVNGQIVGYQRDFNVKNARAVRDSLLKGEILPPVSLALDGHNNLWGVDGQHRMGGAILARIPLWATVQRLDKNQRRSMFLSQRAARRVAPDILTLAGTDPVARYVQEAVIDNANPWAPIVSANRTSKTRISPYSAYQLLLRYVFNVEGQAASYKKNMEALWDRGRADELAPLIQCFGDKQSNPLAFKPGAIQAIGATAMWVFRRNARLQPADRDRWISHMPTFQFQRYLHHTTQQDKTDDLLNHWNKNLGPSRRVRRG